MIKALLKLLLLITLPLAYLFVFNSFSPTGYATERFQEKYVAIIYLGTLEYIANKVDTPNPAERDQLFNKLTKNFNTEIKLTPLNKAVESTSDQQRLRNGELVHLSSDGEVVGYKLKNQDMVITLAVDETDAQDTYRLARGPIDLIRMELINTPPNELSEKITQLEGEFKLSFRLIDSETAQQEMSKNRLIDFGDVVWTTDGEDTEVFYIDLPNNKVLVVDALEYGNLNLWFFGVLAVIVLVFITAALLIWLWPLWKDHQQLNHSATAFGHGNLDTRVNIKKGSFSEKLGNSFNRMADSIQNLISANQQLTNAVAHDLRTPLARLRFALEIIESGKCTEEEAKSYQQTIHKSIDSLDYLINQTLIHSRYNRTADIKHFKESYFSNCIQEEVEQYRFDYDELEFETNIDQKLLENAQWVDPKALERALSNLLSNAAKHADAVIRVSYFQDDDNFYLQVEDDGKGIDSEQIETILQPFSQLNKEQRDSSMGHGLGLAIVNQIAKWHGGEVIIGRSTLGGAKIQLCLPRKIIN